MMKKTHIWLLLLVSLFACQDQKGGFQATAESAMLEDQEMEEYQIPRTAQPPPPPPSNIPTPEEDIGSEQIRNSIEKGSKLIKDGRVKVEVDNLKKTKIQLDSTLKTVKAY